MSPLITRRSITGGLGFAALTASTGVGYAIGVEPHWFHVVHYKLTPPRWPLGLRLKVAVVADIHACDPFMTVRHVDHIVAATNALDADVVTLLGDYIGHLKYMHGPVDRTALCRSLARLQAPLGVHAVLGNHDWMDDRAVRRSRSGSPWIRAALEDAGIPVYENDVRRLVKDGQPFWIAGLGDQWAYSRKTVRDGKVWWENEGVDDVPRVLAALGDDAPAILMAHEPDIFANLSDRFSLTISGHMHGGQVRLAGYAPILPSRYGYRYIYGHIVEQGKHLIVSGGLGCSFLPVRIGARPEIVLIELG